MSEIKKYKKTKILNGALFVWGNNNNG